MPGWKVAVDVVVVFMTYLPSMSRATAAHCRYASNMAGFRWHDSWQALSGAMECHTSYAIARYGAQDCHCVGAASKSCSSASRTTCDMLRLCAAQ